MIDEKENLGEIMVGNVDGVVEQPAKVKCRDYKYRYVNAHKTNAQIRTNQNTPAAP